MISERLAETQKNYLLSLKNPQITSAMLLDLLTQAKEQVPELLSDFQQDTEKNALNPDPISWNAEYFSRHIQLTQNNFARKRIEHLINVREYLEKQGVKGFVPSNPTSSAQPKGTCTVTSDYVPTTNLQKFVAEGDLLTIRTALRMELNNNSLTRVDLQAALEWVKAKVPALFETYTEKAFARGMEADCKLWTSKYYDSQVVYLKTNFSEERLKHLMEVRDLLREQALEGFAALPPKPRASTSKTSAHIQNQKNQTQNMSPSSYSLERNSTFKTALIIGGAVAAFVVLLISLLR